MKKAKLTVKCSDDCYEMELTGPSLEYIKSEVMKERTDDVCEICGADVIKEEEGPKTREEG